MPSQSAAPSPSRWSPRLQSLRSFRLTIAKRLDRIARVLERLERNDTVTLETVALFIRFWLTSTPALPEHSTPAARAKGAGRYDRFVEALGRRLSSGSTVLDEVSTDLQASGTSE
jgi:hypothetical protein